MDQIKKLLQPMQKYGFWIGCVAILIVATGIWFKACSGLRQETRTNLDAINAKYDSAMNLAREQKHPNELTNKAMDALNENALQKVLLAWQKQYNFQENILVWPRELKDDFVAAVHPLKPIETHVDFPTKNEQKLKVDFRARYANYVELLLPRLANMIGATWLSKRNLAAADPNAPQPTTLAGGQPILVDWSTSDQQRLLAMHFDWSTQPDAAPETLQVLYAQEDLWVLTALMGIIKKTNGDIESRHEAAVKSIESVLIGRAAIGKSGFVTRVGGGSGPMGGDPMAGGPNSMYGNAGPMPAMPTMPTTGGPDMMSTGGGRAVSIDPADGRYVDNNFAPLSAEKLRTAMKSENPSDAFLVVAKRMPIRMSLTVDQRRLHRLLAECGNSPLPVEVRQVRLNRTSGSSGGGGGGMMPMGSMPGSMGAIPGAMGGADTSMYGPPGGEGGILAGDSAMEGGIPGMGGSPYGGSGGMGTQSLADRQIVSSTTSYDVPVEIYGIIYIYNPVDRAKLGITDTPPAEVATANSATPAASPAALPTAPAALETPAAAPAAALPTPPVAPAVPAAGPAAPAVPAAGPVAAPAAPAAAPVAAPAAAP